jgi:hypothetical protein
MHALKRVSGYLQQQKCRMLQSTAQNERINEHVTAEAPSLMIKMIIVKVIVTMRLMTFMSTTHHRMIPSTQSSHPERFRNE